MSTSSSISHVTVLLVQPRLLHHRLRCLPYVERIIRIWRQYRVAMQKKVVANRADDDDLRARDAAY